MKIHGIEITNPEGKTFAYCGRDEGEKTNDKDAVTCVHCKKRIKREASTLWYIERMRRIKEAKTK
jgi:hypothetical protein